jgi:hypothetical protein
MSIKQEVEFVGIDMIFPTRLYKFTISPVYIDKILKEITEQERDFEKQCINVDKRGGQSIQKYCTDYGNNIILPTVEKTMEHLSSYLQTIGLTFKLEEYWTARYTEGSFHAPHTHSSSITALVNFSGVLYISSLGGTRLYSTTRSSFDNEWYVAAKSGDLIMFPSTILHASEAFMGKDIRYIVAFNAEVYNT